MENFNLENSSNEERFEEVVLNETPQFFESPSSSVQTNNAVAEPKTKEKKTSKIGIVITCIVLSLVVGAASGFISAKYFSSVLSGDVKPGKDNNVNNSTNVNITVDETVNSSVEAVALKVSPSVVGIRTTAAVQSFFGGSNESTGEGSGVVYTTDGYIITNYHVIESAVTTSKSSIEVFFEDDMENSYSASVVGYNISYDLAVIKIEKNDLVKIELADSSTLKVGQYCVAIGAPGGLEYMGSVTNGIISGLNRSLASSAYEESVPLIQTDTAINPGNSGGALVNYNGELIGINSSKIVSESYEGMGFAIPTNTVVEICNKIIAKENDPDPFVGITFSETWTPEILEENGYPVGAVVSRVVNGGPAYEAGIRSGDIIMEFNDVEITDYKSFNEALSDCKPGASVSVYLYRAGRYYTTDVLIGSNNAQ